jgi:hypothetical protein
MMTNDERAPRVDDRHRPVFWHTEIAAGRVQPMPPRFRWTADGRRVLVRPDPLSHP